MLASLATPALLAPDPDLARALQAPDLNALIELGPPAWRSLRARLREIVAAGAVPAEARVALADCEVLLPVRVTDYVDFYASLEHATNFGRIFRPGAARGARELAPHPDRLPRPRVDARGQRHAAAAPARSGRARRARADARSSTSSASWATSAARPPSARSRSTAPRSTSSASSSSTTGARATCSASSTSRSARFSASPSRRRCRPGSRRWTRSPGARRAARAGPAPATYLRARDPWLLDVALEIELNGEVVSRPAARELYWTPAQMLAHLTVNGAKLTAGDLFATGTVSDSATGARDRSPSCMAASAGSPTATRSCCAGVPATSSSARCAAASPADGSAGRAGGPAACAARRARAARPGRMGVRARRRRP